MCDCENGTLASVKTMRCPPSMFAFPEGGITMGELPVPVEPLKSTFYTCGSNITVCAAPVRERIVRRILRSGRGVHRRIRSSEGTL